MRVTDRAGERIGGVRVRHALERQQARHHCLDLGLGGPPRPHHRLLDFASCELVNGQTLRPECGKGNAPRVAQHERRASVGGQEDPLDDRDVERDQVLSALVNLGYPRARAERVADAAAEEAGEGASIETLIRIALRRLGT